MKEGNENHSLKKGCRKKSNLKTRFCFLMACFILFQLSANPGMLQMKMDFNYVDVSLKRILKGITSKTGYRFFYNIKEIDDNQKVSIRVDGKTTLEVLTDLSVKANFDFKINENQIVLTQKKIAANEFQQREIKGTVTDESGTYLPGANIIEKGTKNGVIADFDGNFSLVVADEYAILLVSYIGYTTKEVPIDGQSVISISLQEDLAHLDEVVVVGYTSKQLSDISGSVSVVSSEQLTGDVTSNNVASLLQGKVAGVIVSNGGGGDPSATSTPIIRGSSSISAGSAPLYVVDGIIGGSANPNDIETITVLKDAASTGLYGSRAANGVIIITTKKGRGKTSINLRANTGVNMLATGHFNIMNSQQLYNYQESFFTPADFASSRPSSLLQQDTDWIDEAFRTGITQDYTASVSGGSEKIQFFTSGNYYNEQGTLKTTGNEKYNLRANISYDISSKLSLNVNVNGGFGEFTNDAAPNALYGAFTNMPWDNPYNPDGSLKMGNEPGWIGRENTNFLHGWQYNLNRTKQTDMTGDLNLIYKIIPKLTFSTFNRVNYKDSKNELYYDSRSKVGLGTNGKLDNNFLTSSGLITSNRLQYKNSFGKHLLDLLLVGEAEKNTIDSNGIIANGLPAGLAVMSVASSIISASGNTVDNAFSKGLVQADYSYDSRFFAVGSFISESSSLFGSSKRSANFYTLAGSWILSNEHFMENQNIVNFLKVRASYGVTGNAQITEYQSLGLYEYAYQYSGLSASVPTQLANSDLTWEKAKTTNLGLDLGFFKRISMNIDLYDKTTESLLLNVPLPYTSGYSSVFRNVGSVQNRGLEINLNTDNLIGDFSWKTNFNIALNNNEVLKLNEGQDILIGLQNVSVGHDLNSWYMRKWAGVDPQNGDPLWEKISTDANGGTNVATTNVYSDASLQFSGTASPKFTGGMMNTFVYKNFSLDVFFNWVSGNKVYNNSREFFDSDGSYQTYNSMLLMNGWSRWLEPGDVATHPKSVLGGNKLSNKPSSRYLEDGSYIRLRNIKFSYQLPDLGRTNIAQIKMFISGDNLWTGTNYSGMDPEVLLGPGGGYSNMQYPNSKKVLIGINVNF